MYPSFFKCFTMLICEMENICVGSHVNWIILNQCFSLVVIIIDGSLAKAFLVFKIKISTYSVPNYGTTFINSTYLFFFLFGDCILFFLSRNNRASNDKDVSHFLPFLSLQNIYICYKFQLYV